MSSLLLIGQSEHTESASKIFQDYECNVHRASRRTLALELLSQRSYDYVLLWVNDFHLSEFQLFVKSFQHRLNKKSLLVLLYDDVSSVNFNLPTEETLTIIPASFLLNAPGDFFAWATQNLNKTDCFKKSLASNAFNFIEGSVRGPLFVFQEHFLPSIFQSEFFTFNIEEGEGHNFQVCFPREMFLDYLRTEFYSFDENHLEDQFDVLLKKWRELFLQLWKRQVHISAQGITQGAGKKNPIFLYLSVPFGDCFVFSSTL